MTDPLLDSLATAVAAAPHDAELRVVYADRLAAAGRTAEAIGQASVVLAADPTHARAGALLAQLTASSPSNPPTPPESPTEGGASPDGGIDWQRLEQEVGSPLAPPYVIEEVYADGSAGVSIADDPLALEGRRETTTLADVGGLELVKKRLRESFLDPMAHPEIAKAFKKSMRGGLLLYGPPGCGKTFIARAIAGELGASFFSVTIADVLSKWLGESEGNMHAVFETTRRAAPAVLFFDEVDALGGKRSMNANSGGMRQVVNQLLLEMDGVGSDNDGVYVLAATNHPWDVDPALLRPGRFDRMLLVLPPDAPAREAIIRHHLRDRPIEGIDLARLVARTQHFSGADVAHLCTTAAEQAMADSIQAGQVRPIRMTDFDRALDEVRPSIGPWLESARNVASFGNSDGRYDDLVAYLRSRKML